MLTDVYFDFTSNVKKCKFTSRNILSGKLKLETALRRNTNWLKTFLKIYKITIFPY